MFGISLRFDFKRQYSEKIYDNCFNIEHPQFDQNKNPSVVQVAIQLGEGNLVVQNRKQIDSL